jgi:hypothetical protein
MKIPCQSLDFKANTINPISCGWPLCPEVQIIKTKLTRISEIEFYSSTGYLAKLGLLKNVYFQLSWTGWDWGSDQAGCLIGDGLC